LVKNTNEQAAALQGRFQEHTEVTVFSGQRYWHPFIEEVANEIRAERFERIILIPLFPHYSTTTTLSIINEWNRHGAGLPKPLVVERFFGLPEYSHACAERFQASERYGESYNEQA
jgi:ferrochelatase